MRSLNLLIKFNLKNKKLNNILIILFLKKEKLNLRKFYKLQIVNIKILRNFLNKNVIYLSNFYS